MGSYYSPQVCLLADAMGSLLGYDALCQANPNYSRGLSTYDSRSSLNDPDPLQLRPDQDQDSTLKRSDIHQDLSTHTCGNDQHSGKTNIESSRLLSHSDPDLCPTSGGLSEKQFSKSDIVSSEYKLRRQCSTNVRTHPPHLGVSESTKEESVRRTSMGSCNDGSKMDFEVSDFFTLGSPLGLVLAYRRIFLGDDRNCEYGLSFGVNIPVHF